MGSVSPSLVCPLCGSSMARGARMCRACKARLSRETRTESEILKDPKTAARFLRKITKPNGDDGCWLFVKSLNPNGYGAVKIGKRTRPAHRVSYELFVGPIDDGLGVLHRCDTPACVNPAHLFLGTARDNMTDCAIKGRVRTQKLTAEDVRDIRARAATGLITQADLAREYGLAPTTVMNIVKRRTWRFVD